MTGRRHRDAGAAERTPDQRLASLHLRTGSLSLARAELETMAGDGALDDDALIDLAEVRWRTGDLPGAGEAADAYLEAGHETTLSLVIAAEAQAALGRPSEARRLADRAIARADRSLDAVFAGLARSSIWPRDVSSEVVAQPEAIGSGAAIGRRGLAGGAAPPGGQAPVAGSVPASTPTDAGAPSAGPGSGGGPGHEPDGSRALQAAEEALADDDPLTAAIQLALALRASPALAPAVLELARGQEGPAFDVIRGDAFRLVGREGEARRSFAAAAVSRPEDDAAPPAAPMDQAAPEADAALPEPKDPDPPDRLEAS